MKNLIPTINEIVKFGLQPNLTITEKEKSLEKNLVKIYDLYFQIEYEYDKTKYENFDKGLLPNIRKNVETNFQNFGFYKTILDINELNNFQDIALGDAIDDLSDIIIDLLQVKWRIETNSLANGLWYFELIFCGHTQQHMLDLLNFMKQNNG